MKCLRFDLWKNFPGYVDNELSASKISQIEDHLLDCNSCRVRLAHLRDGQRFALKLERRKPLADHWETLAAALDKSPSTPISLKIKRPAIAWRNFRLSPWVAVGALCVAVVVLSTVLIIQHKEAREMVALQVSGVVDKEEFHPVSISDMENNTRPHIVAEGYVSEVKLSDEEDGDLKFKLVEDIERPSPFIICEIISPIKIDPPAVGSRVRVYGVSRYDAEAGREWYEVHPVLNIEAVNTAKRNF
jgi:hypothetical protein